MRVVIQIVKDATLKIEDITISSIPYGMLLLVSFNHDDTKEKTQEMAEKIAKMRIFPDENGKTNLDITAVSGEVLSVSQFTLYGEFKSRRPSFTNVLPGKESSKLYNYFNENLRKYVKVETGVFGAKMNITFTNCGPVTYVVEN